MLNFNNWVRFPSRSDPRLPFLGILIVFLVLGIGFLGFNRTPLQVLFTVGATVLLDFFFDRLFRRQEPPLFPLSAMISGLSLSILINYAHGYWPVLIPVFLTVASKYLLTFKGRHVINPSLFGVAVSLLAFGGFLSVSSPQQWGNSLSIMIFIVTAALVLFVFRIQRTHLIVSFLGFYFLLTALRAWLFSNLLPPETLFLSTLASPEFYLFTFFMLIDPATSPAEPRKQVLAAAVISGTDAALQIVGQVINTLFLSALLFGLVRLLLLHLSQLDGKRTWAIRAAVIGSVAMAAWGAHYWFIAVHDDLKLNFQLEEISGEATGIRSRPGQVLQQIDPRAAHMAKWILHSGDAVAVADVDGDERLDLFLTNPLKAPEDRAALYLNQGDYRFERFPIPALTTFYADPAANGVPAGALLVDWDNDGGQDLIVLTLFGKLRLLRNMLVETGKLDFVDVTDQRGIDDYATSVAANAIDIDRDGLLDLVVGNYYNPMLAKYPTPVPLNPFTLPQPEFSGDRRMFYFLQTDLFSANNGGGIVMYRNTGQRLVKLDTRNTGVDDQRFVLAIGAGDLNNDGWMDLYIANDFGPDHLLLNQGDGKLLPMRDRFGQLGNDHYKGMNASIGDLMNKGYQDIYVSNLHVKGLTEGSMLWVNHGIRTVEDLDRIDNQALQKNVLNDDRWGWGAAMGDMDLDGRLDILQANGMWDQAYDTQWDRCRQNIWFYINIVMAGTGAMPYVDNWMEARGSCLFANQLNRVYLNRGQYFVDVAEQVGWTRRGVSRAVALADLSNTGKLDAIVTRQFGPVSIYQNTLLQETHWVGLQLQGDPEKHCNRDAIGTRVTIRYDMAGETLQQMREVQAANGFSAQGDRRLLFGLGTHIGEVTATIDWCGQSRQTVTLAQKKYHQLVQP